jgi:hypothetical protein
VLSLGLNALGSRDDGKLFLSALVCLTLLLFVALADETLL